LLVYQFDAVAQRFRVSLACLEAGQRSFEVVDDREKL
jgi:hypothetical protein